MIIPVLAIISKITSKPSHQLCSILRLQALWASPWEYPLQMASSNNQLHQAQATTSFPQILAIISDAECIHPFYLITIHSLYQYISIKLIVTDFISHTSHYESLIFVCLLILILCLPSLNFMASRWQFVSIYYILKLDSILHTN
jgi:hypothetical protein